MDLTTLPDLSREVLADMGGWTALRGARRRVDSGGIKAIEWHHPGLGGTVEDGGSVYQPELDLRSLTFVRNRCSCRTGRSGQVCEHSLALCLRARQLDRERPVDAMPARSGPAGRVLPGTWMVVDGSPKYLSILLRDRDHPQYRTCAEWLRSEGFHPEPSNGKWWLRDQHKVLNFLARQGPRLDRDYAPGYTDGFRERTAGIAEVGISCSTSRERGQHVVRMELTGKGIEARDIRNALVSGSNYIVRDNAIHLVRQEVLDNFAKVSRTLGGDPGMPVSGIFQARFSDAQLVDTASVLESADLEAQLPDDWKQRSAAIREVGRLEAPPLEPVVSARFRSYQLIGTAWLWHLYRNNLGGILADEMGLGKTIQAIGLILCWRSSGQPNGPVLVVAPASLLGNWQRELRAWAPGLTVYRHHGAQRLQSFWPEGEVPDVCLTSYSTLRNDADLFHGSEFSLSIADEAQHVKNRRTHAARSLRQIRSVSRFVLTGTPIENSIDDLRAIFDYCLPGYLKRPPSDCRGEERDWYQKRHLEMAAPYILRRSKQLVAPELPEKIEQTIWCGLTGPQQDLYDDIRRKNERALLDLAAGGASENQLRFTLLTQLLRLRQVCADPGMLDSEFPMDQSAKFVAFQELLEEALDGGHRILVFSQFVQLLKRLRAWLEESGTPCCYIDGSTRDRLAVCDKFNRDRDIPLCLISLKAGGTGLNLTGADTVVHFDPWWNPAVEDQATDRAHRIGQTRVVTSYKLATEATVEEKVLELQVKKAALLKDLLDESAHQTAKVDLGTLKALLS